MTCNASILSTDSQCKSAYASASALSSPSHSTSIAEQTNSAWRQPDPKTRTIYLVFEIDPITGAESMSGICARTQLEARRKAGPKDRIVQFQRASEM